LIEDKLDIVDEEDVDDEDMDELYLDGLAKRLFKNFSCFIDLTATKKIRLIPSYILKRSDLSSDLYNL
jgi:hypothetical protein